MTTGAGNDLERATELARKMVCEWGMSAAMGPLTFGKKEEQIFLGREIAQHQDYSEDTAIRIDQEVKRIVTANYERAHRMLDRATGRRSSGSPTRCSRARCSTPSRCKRLAAGESLEAVRGRRARPPVAADDEARARQRERGADRRPRCRRSRSRCPRNDRPADPATALHRAASRAGVRLELGERTLVMAVINITPDSFAEASRLGRPRAGRSTWRRRPRHRGADILDLGAESTRPGFGRGARGRGAAAAAAGAARHRRGASGCRSRSTRARPRSRGPPSTRAPSNRERRQRPKV